MYIHDEGILNEIHASSHYRRIKSDLKDKMVFCDDVRKLEENGVYTLIDWLEAAAEVKAGVHGITKGTLNTFLEDVRNSMKVRSPNKLEGLYESVYNARWSHLVEVPGGEGMGLEVREGEPPQSWTYKAVGESLEKDDAVQQSGAPRPTLMVLTSDKGWPYTWNRKGVESPHDCYVNCEVERVWQIVKGDLTELFSPHREAGFMPKKRLLIGTPGIGKSMAAGSYLLYQLLHYDAEQLQIVVYFIADRTFLFDKTSKKVSIYMGDPSNASVVNNLSERGMKGYIIHDVAEPDHEPVDALPPRGWSMIVVSPPLKRNYKYWRRRDGVETIIMNCPDESDVKAMCVWMRRHQPLWEQAWCWQVVKGQMDEVGPIPRYIFDERKYDNWVQRCHDTVDGNNSSLIERCNVVGHCGYWEDNNVPRCLVKVVRRRLMTCLEYSYTVPVSAHLGNKLLFKLPKLMQPTHFTSRVWFFMDYLISEDFGRCTVFAFLDKAFVRAIKRRLRELRPSAQGESHRSALAVYSQNHSTSYHVLPPLEHFSEKIDLEWVVLYVTEAGNFPLVDAFFL
ncbi:retrotransposon hot spot (RHS) protein, putative [Trypanosoma cruzi marinkellei]|uniref:Retrotransposon hot spot (RHS) protein, putative n=1 Tax=Trypanosoma cruzi marinkellei TaxID=85056 RepID=K2MB38_TRYCR|nr:retrotransposon hot spot (RHS) protein, putative [Trypanosoma cruzi marinkellei]